MIERWQAEKLQEKIRPMLAYLHRLQYRMEKTGRHTGKLYELVRNAHHAVHALSVDLHYRSCLGGVYQEREK
jgi:hypothetical protein